MIQPKAIPAAPSVRTLLLAALAMVFFAANSLLARLALRGGEIDGGSFTAIRIAAGAIALALCTGFRRAEAGAARRHGSLAAACALFTYAITFSYAYVSLNAGTGALVLFAAVQMTMLSIGFASGERPRRAEWAGVAVAMGGLVYLVSSGLSAPSPAGVFLMAASGMAWGYYSLAAREVRAPIAATAGNFIRATPMAVGALLVAWVFEQPHASWRGAGLAAITGAATSGLGYAIWYVAVKGLRTSLAAVVQLLVPFLTAAAGVTLLGEQLTWRLVAASGAILGGVGLALSGRARDRKTVLAGLATGPGSGTPSILLAIRSRFRRARLAKSG